MKPFGMSWALDKINSQDIIFVYSLIPAHRQIRIYRKNGCKYCEIDNFRFRLDIHERFARNFSIGIFLFWFSQPQKGKTATKGAKQIVEENAATLKFYQYMAAGSTTIFFAMIFLFFEFTGVVSVGHLVSILRQPE